MSLTISTFRKRMFELVGIAMHGQPIEFIHKGVVFKVTAEGSPQSSKLSRLTPQPVIAPGADLNHPHLLPEMESAWEKDWSDL